MRGLPSTVRTAVVGAVMLLVGIAGVSKCADLPFFEHDVQTWSLIPTDLRALIVLIVPPLEIAAALAWFLGLARGPAVAAVALLLAGATGVYALHLFSGSQPRCGCSGGLAALQFLRREGPALLARNTALLTLLGAGVLIRPRPPAPQPEPDP